MAHPQTGRESPGYYILVEDSSTQTTERDFFILEHTREAGTQTTEQDFFILEHTREAGTQTTEEFISQETTRDASKQTSEEENGSLEHFSSEENNSDMRSETSEEKRKRKISNEEEITNDTDAYKRSRPEVCGISDQVISNTSDNGFINPDSGSNEITMSGQIAFDSGSLECSNSEFPNSEESHSKNQELIASDCLDKDVHLSTGQCTAYNMNIFQKENVACKFTDSDVDKVEKVGSGEGILTVPCTSWCLENNSLSKLCVEKVQNGSPLKQQPPVETEQELSTCFSCKKTISRHVEVHDGTDMYRCCRCISRYVNFNSLQIHIYNEHTWSLYCHVCQMKYLDVDSHARDQTCEVCNQNFECKYQLEEHYFSVHEGFNKTNCRICKEELYKHFSKEVKIYQCCFRECKIQKKAKSKFTEHLYTHFPLKIHKCEVCEKHFKFLSNMKSHLRDNHPLCELCEKRFLNIYFRYQHLREEHI